MFAFRVCPSALLITVVLLTSPLQPWKGAVRICLRLGTQHRLFDPILSLVCCSRRSGGGGRIRGPPGNYLSNPHSRLYSVNMVVLLLCNESALLVHLLRPGSSVRAVNWLQSSGSGVEWSIGGYLAAATVCRVIVGPRHLI